jgi:hypothetical protein
VLDPRVQARNHDPSQVWDPMIDYAMMSLSRGTFGYRDSRDSRNTRSHQPNCGHARGSSNY